MKKSIFIVILLQLLLLIMICNSLLSRYRLLRFTVMDKTNLSISFSSTESVTCFLDYLDQKGLAVIKAFNHSDDEISIYMSDPSYSAEIKLISGKYPVRDGYVCDKECNNDPDQCGLIKPLLPEYSVKLYNIENEIRPGISDIYIINTSNSEILRKMKDELNQKGVHIDYSDTYAVSPLLILLSSFPGTHLILTLAFFFSVLLSFSILIFSFQQKKQQEKGILFILSNRISECIAVILFLVIFSFLPSLYKEFQTEYKNRDNFIDNDYLYRLAVNDLGQASSLSFETSLYPAISSLYETLCKNNDAFIMDADYIYNIEMFNKNIPLTGLITDGFHTHIIVSPNYFIFNPIYNEKGKSVSEDLVFSDHTLNLLVPEKFSSISEQLKEEFLEDFNFHKYEIYENVYQSIDQNNEYSEDKVPTEINLIYVKNDQSYFTFSPLICKSRGNRVFDPVAVVYTNNVHPSNLLYTASRSLYFVYNSDSLSLYDYLTGITGIENLVYATSVKKETEDRFRKIETVLFFNVGVLLIYSVIMLSIMKEYKKYLKSASNKIHSRRQSLINASLLVLPVLIAMIIIIIINTRRIIRQIPQISFSSILLICLIMIIASIIIPSGQKSASPADS